MSCACLITFHLQAQLVWAATKTRRGTVVAKCDPLGLTVEADNNRELASIIGESLHVLMLDLYEDGELPRFLQEHGWTPNHPLPVSLPEGGVKFDVPFHVDHGHA